MSNNFYETDSQKATDAIIDEATEWLLRLQDSGINDADKQGFTRWLKRSPLHVWEYLRAEATWAVLEGIDPERKMEIDVASTDADNIVALSHTKVIKNSEKAGVMSWFKVFAVAASVTLFGLASWLYLQPDTQVYQTGVGEQHRVVLTDGSVIELNTKSEIEVAFSGRSREVRLSRGEALFKVRADSERPFIVFGDQARVEVLGTEFNIYQRVGQATVTVLEGLVAVRDKRLSGRDGIQVAAGYEVNIDANTSRLVPVTASTERVLAWREQRLIFDNSTLADAVEEFNRYNRRQLIILDPILKAQEINGVFDADRPEALMRFLVQSGSARVVKETDNRIILESVL